MSVVECASDKWKLKRKPLTVEGYINIFKLLNGEYGCHRLVHKTREEALRSMKEMGEGFQDSACIRIEFNTEDFQGTTTISNKEETRKCPEIRIDRET